MEGIYLKFAFLNSIFLIIVFASCADTTPLIIHYSDPEQPDLSAVVQRTNKLKSFLDLITVDGFFIDHYIHHPDISSFENALKTVRSSSKDSVHIFISGENNYDPLPKRIKLSRSNIESEKVLLHELIHHRLDDLYDYFPHYSDKEPTCKIGDTSFWCTNLMSNYYYPFSVMLTEKQYSTIQTKAVSRDPDHYCQERNVYPKNKIFLAYQDTILCCKDLQEYDCSTFSEYYYFNGNSNPTDMTAFCEALKDTLQALHSESQGAFCSSYLSIDIINRLRHLIVEKPYVIYDPDNTGIQIPISILSIKRPAAMTDSEIVQTFTDFYFAQHLNNPYIKKYARKEAEILSEIYDEPAENIYSRNMGLYQKDLIIRTNRYYDENNISFTFGKSELESISYFYDKFPSLSVKGILYKGIDLHLSRSDIESLLPSLP